MVSRDRDVVDDAYVTVLPAADPDFLFGPLALSREQLFCVDDVEDFLLVVIQALEHDEVFLRLLDTHNIHNLVLVRDFERQDLLADLAVHLVKLQHHLALVDPTRSFSLKPRS